MASQERTFDVYLLDDSQPPADDSQQMADDSQPMPEESIDDTMPEDTDKDFKWKAKGGFLHCHSGPSSLTPDMARQLFSSPKFGDIGPQVAEEWISTMMQPQTQGNPPTSSDKTMPPAVNIYSKAAEKKDNLGRGKSSVDLNSPLPSDAVGDGESGNDSSSEGTLEWATMKKRENRQRQKMNKMLKKHRK